MMTFNNTRTLLIAAVFTSILLSACDSANKEGANTEITNQSGPQTEATAEKNVSAAPRSDEVSPQIKNEHQRVTVKEHYMTVRDEGDNVDSVAVWHGADDTHWLIATAKDTDQLMVFEAATGKLLQKVGGAGSELGQFLRPNGISVIDDIAIVVERDNQRLQVLSLPDFQPLGAFGQEQLRRPYGLWVTAVEEGYRVYITDAYETASEEIPPVSELNKRLHLFAFQRNGDGITSEWLRSAGETEGEGILFEVESLWGDAENNRLFVSDESEQRKNVKVFDLELNFTGDIVGDGLFKFEPEGIALYACPDGSGYWLVADQHESVNTFLLFDRSSLQPIGQFEGEKTLNTDGIWLTQQSFANFPAGAFYAVHDDGNVAAFDMSAILEATDMSACDNSLGQVQK